MKKQNCLLIDAIHITMGGGRVLLEYLCESLASISVPFVLLRDSRCKTLANINDEIVLSGEMERRRFYKKNRNTYSAVFCFANIPPTVSLTCPVYTYFHNINLLRIPESFSLKRHLVTLLKRIYIYTFSKNTSSWIVQTSNTENCLRNVLPCKGKDVKIYPFYRSLKLDDQTDISGIIPKDYVLIGDYTGTRGHDELLDAWKVLSDSGYSFTLHMTVARDNPFSERIEAYRSRGVKVVNHGIVSHEMVKRLYKMSKATVYPSMNESLGLGIIEAIEAGCDVIGADLPYLHSICVPSVMFEKVSPKDIANAVIQYEKNAFPKSKLIISNRIDDLLTYILR